MISQSSLFILTIRVRIKSLDPSPEIYVPFCKHTKHNKEKVKSKEECHHKIQYLCQLDHSSILDILLSEIN